MDMVLIYPAHTLPIAILKGDIGSYLSQNVYGRNPYIEKTSYPSTISFIELISTDARIRDEICNY
jgi:hypothetical protein